jgi:hypothetical protein
MQIGAQDIEHILMTIIICEYSVEAPKKKNLQNNTNPKRHLSIPFTIDLDTKMDLDGMRLLMNPKPIYLIPTLVHILWHYIKALVPRAL